MKQHEQSCICFDNGPKNEQCSNYPVKKRHRILDVGVDSVDAAYHLNHLLLLLDSDILLRLVLVSLQTDCVDSINKVDCDTRLEGAVNVDWRGTDVCRNESTR